MPTEILNTATRKTLAIQTLHTDLQGHMNSPWWTVENIASRIRELSPHIKSPKWRNAVESYASFVEAHPESLDWAYFQGSVYFAYEVS